MSVLEAETTPPAAATAAATTTCYHRGDRVSVTSPDGQRFLLRVEVATPSAAGVHLTGAVVEPRRFRGHVITTLMAQPQAPAITTAA